MEHIWKAAYSIWWWMQKHEWTFRFVLWLKKLGATLAVKHWLVRHRDAKLRKHPNEGMRRAAEFFDKNRERVERVLSLLEDDKSKAVLGGGNRLSNQEGPLAARALLRRRSVFCTGYYPY